MNKKVTILLAAAVATMCIAAEHRYGATLAGTNAAERAKNLNPIAAIYPVLTKELRKQWDERMTKYPTNNADRIFWQKVHADIETANNGITDADRHVLEDLNSKYPTLMFGAGICTDGMIHVTSLDPRGQPPWGNDRFKLDTITNINEDIRKLRYLKALFFTVYDKGDLDFTLVGELPKLEVMEAPLDTTDTDLLAMQNLPKMKALYLELCRGIKGEFVHALTNGCDLKDIDVASISITTTNLALLRQIPNIRVRN